MLNLTLTERSYIAELIRKDQKEKKPVSNQFCIDADELIQYLEAQGFVGGTDEEIDLCPGCNVYCLKRFIDGRCE